MPKYSEHEKSKEIQLLFSRAQAGEIGPTEFCRELSEKGISEALSMLYLREAFGLPLDKSKELVVKTYYGSVEAWADEMSDALDGLETELKES